MLFIAFPISLHSVVTDKIYFSLSITGIVCLAKLWLLGNNSCLVLSLTKFWYFEVGILYNPLLKPLRSGVSTTPLLLIKSDKASSTVGLIGISFCCKKLNLFSSNFPKNDFAFPTLAPFISLRIPTKMNRVRFCGMPYSPKLTNCP